MKRALLVTELDYRQESKLNCIWPSGWVRLINYDWAVGSRPCPVLSWRCCLLPVQFTRIKQVLGRYWGQRTARGSKRESKKESKWWWAGERGEGVWLVGISGKFVNNRVSCLVSVGCCYAQLWHVRLTAIVLLGLPWRGSSWLTQQIKAHIKGEWIKLTGRAGREYLWRGRGHRQRRRTELSYLPNGNNLIPTALYKAFMCSTTKHSGKLQEQNRWQHKYVFNIGSQKFKNFWSLWRNLSFTSNKQ